MTADGGDTDPPKGRNSEGKLYGGDGSGDGLDMLYRVVDNINDWLPTKAALDIVYGLFTGADLNGNPMMATDYGWAAVGIIPMGKASIATKSVTGWVKRSVYQSFDKTVQKDIARAVAKGIVAPKGNSGIIKLTASEAQSTGYTYKLKMMGEKSKDLRIYGNANANGHIYFETPMTHKKNR
ncbi:hypothetical protein ACPDHL_09500 [Myroides sp. C15-4]|uniref:hypothetical protein n=1 Tax=Myroides sp. C15-4 TaxID=3400532 RepID=UPI003D2F725E